MRAAVARWLALILIVAARVVVAADQAEPAVVHGMTLAKAIAALDARGLSIIYSTDLVAPWMIVQADPVSAAPAAILDEILAPHQLGTRAGPYGVLLVVRRGSLIPSPDRGAPDPVRDGLSVEPRLPLESIIVTARPYQLTRGFEVAPVAMSGADIAKLPDLGEDALRAVERLPGATANGLSADTHIRGSDAGETLVRFDGVRLYSPFHLRDFQSIFSAIDPSIIDAADIYTGALPVNFGNRMGGAIDITSLTPPATRYGEASLSFFNAAALSAGEFADGNGTWLTAARRSNLDIWYHAISQQSGTPSYVDAFGKVTYRTGEHTQLSFSTLYISDDVTLSDEDGDEHATAEYGDTYHWIRMDQHPVENLEGSTWFSHARLASHRDGSSVQTGVSVGNLAEERLFQIDELQTEWRWQPANRWRVQFGGNWVRSRGHYDYRDDAEFAVLFDAAGTSGTLRRTRAIALDPRGERYGFYGSATLEATPRLSTSLGVRWDRQALDSEREARLSPRFALNFQLNARSNLRLTLNRLTQSPEIDELDVSDGETRFHESQYTDQLELGFEHRFENSVVLRVDAYQRRIERPRPHFENLLNSLTLLPELKPDRVRVAPRRARAHGFEIFLQRKLAGPFSWWLAYSRASVIDEFDGVETPRSWDQRHAVSTGVNWSRNKWDLGMALLYRSGWPTTRIQLRTDGATPLAVTDGRNRSRLLPFGSVDLRVGRRFDLDRSTLSTFLEISNASNRMNQCCTAYEIDDETGLLELERRDYLPLIPSLGVVWQF
jgi:hypothetical protein